MLSVLIPTYKRPFKLADLAKNIEETTHYPFKIYFGVEKDDRESLLAAKDTGHQAIVNDYEPGYSNTVQTIYEQTNEPFIFCANDDFEFLPKWDKEAIDKLKASEHLMVCGLHDGYQHTRYYTLHMIKREYIEKRSGVIDIPNRVFYPYHHNYQDTEFTETAIARGVWDRTNSPSIIHRHPDIYPEVERDETYNKNNKTSAQDAETFNSRRHLWQ